MLRKASVTERALKTIQKPEHPGGHKVTHGCKNEAQPNAAKKPRRKLSVRQQAAILLSEIARLRFRREQHGIELNLDKWLFVVCHTLAPLKERNGGLDLCHLHDFQRHHALSFDNDDAVAMIHKVCDYRERYSEVAPII